MCSNTQIHSCSRFSSNTHVKLSVFTLDNIMLLEWCKVNCKVKPAHYETDSEHEVQTSISSFANLNSQLLSHLFSVVLKLENQLSNECVQITSIACAHQQAVLLLNDVFCRHREWRFILTQSNTVMTNVDKSTAENSPENKHRLSSCLSDAKCFRKLLHFFEHGNLWGLFFMISVFLRRLWARGRET